MSINFDMLAFFLFKLYIMEVISPTQMSKNIMYNIAF